MTILINLAFCAFYARFAYLHSLTVLGGQWHVLPFVVQESLLAVLFLLRRPSRATSRKPQDWIAGFLGTFLPLLIRPGAASYAIGVPLQMIGLTISIGALVTLGRSFGIIAADRDVKTTGLYAVVRHPMYLGHTLTLIGYFCTYPSEMTAMLVGMTLGALVARIYAEESFLWGYAEDDYHVYMRRVRYRLIPGVF